MKKQVIFSVYTLLIIWLVVMGWVVVGSYFKHQRAHEEIEKEYGPNKIELMLQNPTHNAVARAFCRNSKELIDLRQEEHDLTLKQIANNDKDVQVALRKVHNRLMRTRREFDQDAEYLESYGFDKLSEEECKYIFRGY